MPRRQAPGNTLSRILKPWKELKINLWSRDALDGAVIVVVGKRMDSETGLIGWDITVWNPDREKYIDAHEILLKVAKISADRIATNYGYRFVKDCHVCMM